MKLRKINRWIGWLGLRLAVVVYHDGEPTRLLLVFVGWLDQDGAWARHCERTQMEAMP